MAFEFPVFSTLVIYVINSREWASKIIYIFYYLRFNTIVCYLIWYKGTTTAPKCLKMAKNSSCMKNEAFYFKTLKPPLSRCGNLDT